MEEADLSSRMPELTEVRKGLIEYDPAFSAEERTKALELLVALVAGGDEPGTAGYELALAEIAAVAGNGHTQLLPARWASAFPRLAVRFVVTDDGLFVADALPGYENLIGARVRSLGGTKLPDLREAWARYTSGSPTFRDETLPHFLEAPAILHAAGLARSANAVRLELADGRVADIATAEGWSEPTGVWKFLPPPRLMELAESGRIAASPLYLQEPDSTLRVVDLPEHRAAYVQFRANHDFSGETNLGEKSDQAIGMLRELGRDYIIVDQRFNIGGDLNSSRDLMQAIPEIIGPKGHVFAIVSGRTFSAGISSVGYLRQAAGDRLTIIGEPIGDDLEFWAEGDPLTLPSGIMFLRATERHNYRTGCPEADCHGSIRRYPIRVPHLEPDFHPVFTYSDLVTGSDPYLDAALALIPAN